jgi:hypothetical protein
VERAGKARDTRTRHMHRAGPPLPAPEGHRSPWRSAIQTFSGFATSIG